MAELRGLSLVAQSLVGGLKLVVFPKGSVLGPVLFSSFINDRDEELKCILSKFVGDTKLGGVADKLEGCAAIQ